MKQIHHADCLLCRSSTVTDFAVAHGRRYGTCATCGLIQMTREHHLTPAAELAHYHLHQNDPADAGYRAFLNRLGAPLAARLPAGAEGLDYGSGPGPTLSVMLEEQGFRLQLYDPFFAPGIDVLNRTYDFITCTETVEHFFHPADEFDRLDRMLRPGGWLGIMTEVFRDHTPFGQWRYARDPTHTCLYRPETMAWIAERFGYRMREPHPTVRLFQKPLPPPPAGADE
ncbi:MAG: class I SAM-dependent methyltransferase [Gemmatimonadales bacterium]